MHVVGAADDPPLQALHEDGRVAAIVFEMKRLQLDRPWCGKEAAERLRKSMGVSTSAVEEHLDRQGEWMAESQRQAHSLLGLPGARLHHAHRVPPRPLSVV